MTKKETEELIRNISGFFPSWKPKVSPRELIDSWYDILRKYEYEPIKDMLRDYIENDESGFAPGISQLVPKNKQNGFSGRIYSHADFVEMEKAALKETMGGLI